MTIPSPRQFASMTNIGSLSRLGVVYFLWAIFLFMSGEAHAQVFTPKEGMLSRDIIVEQYQKGGVVATWPWVNYGLYYESLLQMAYDPVLPPSRWSVIPGLLDRLVITERAQNGQLLRRFQVTDQDYVYTYQSYAYKYKRDLGKFSNMLQDVFKSLPEDYSTRENSADGGPRGGGGGGGAVGGGGGGGRVGRDAGRGGPAFAGHDGERGGATAMRWS